MVRTRSFHVSRVLADTTPGRSNVEFLGIHHDMTHECCGEARESTGASERPPLRAKRAQRQRRPPRAARRSRSYTSPSNLHDRPSRSSSSPSSSTCLARLSRHCDGLASDMYVPGPAVPTHHLLLLRAANYPRITTQVLLQILNFASVLATGLMIWKGLGLVCNTESPIVVVLRCALRPLLPLHLSGSNSDSPRHRSLHPRHTEHSGSMEPAFYRGDLLFLTNPASQRYHTGDITVYKVPGADIPIVHRVLETHNAVLQRKGCVLSLTLTLGDVNVDTEVWEREGTSQRARLRRTSCCSRRATITPWTTSTCTRASTGSSGNISWGKYEGACSPSLLLFSFFLSFFSSRHC